MEYKVSKKVLGFDINAVVYKIGLDLVVSDGTPYGT